MFDNTPQNCALTEVCEGRLWRHMTKEVRYNLQTPAFLDLLSYFWREGGGGGGRGSSLGAVA